MERESCQVMQLVIDMEIEMELERGACVKLESTLKREFL